MKPRLIARSEMISIGRPDLWRMVNNVFMHIGIGPIKGSGMWHEEDDMLALGASRIEVLAIGTEVLTDIYKEIKCLQNNRKPSSPPTSDTVS